MCKSHEITILMWCTHNLKRFYRGSSNTNSHGNSLSKPDIFVRTLKGMLLTHFHLVCAHDLLTLILVHQSV